MKLKREKIKEFDIPKEYMIELLDYLEEGLKEIETEINDKIVYDVINNIIRNKYSNKKYKSRGKEFILNLIKSTISGQGDKHLIEMWYELANKIKNEKFNKDEKLTTEDMLNIDYGIETESNDIKGNPEN